MVKYKSEESRQRVLEASKKGHEFQKRESLKRQKEYYNSPNLCLNCNKPIDYFKRTYKFCSRSCSAIYSNNKRIIKKYCENCGKEVVNKEANKYCSRKCMSEYHHEKNLEKANVGLLNGTLNDREARNWFRKISDKKCSICKRTHWMGKPIPLIVDHVDGNHNNNHIENLRMVCCNCDAQLPTYKSKNKGNGRTGRRI